jgi:L-ascorbate metabolism protein UlaG (beta-lactamase superfamily)
LNLRSAGAIIYVDGDAGGIGDGSSWADAYTELQDALDAAQCGDEVWVVEGVYTPTNTSGRDATFELVDGVALYGGFAGTETSRDQRDWDANATVLSGDLDGDDLTDARGVITDTANIVGGNAYHVVTMDGMTTSTVLDGFIITAGSADGETWPRSCGGGIYGDNSSLMLANVRLVANRAGQMGGGMCSVSGSSPKIINARFIGNSASDGGGMYNYGSSPSVVGAVFSGNEAEYRGGGIFNLFSSPLLTNVTLSGNLASDGGGGMHNHSSNPRLTNCILWGNTPDEVYDYRSSTTVSYSDVRGGCEGTGNINADPLFVDADGVDDIHGTLDDDLRLQTMSPAVDAADNTAVPPDLADLDCDGDTAEQTPLDLSGVRRFADMPFVDDTGSGFSPIVDMGAYEARVVYVSSDASGAADGSSWANAYRNLQDALEDTESGDEIWVAGGVYTPTNTSGRDASFGLADGMLVYGGFAGTETSRDQRDWEAHATVLSGDLDGDDLTDASGVVTDTANIASGNAYHVVVSMDVNGKTVLDGFFITGGKADGDSYPHSHGGGMYSDNASATLSNIRFSGNFASGDGGGMYNRDGTPTLTNVIFVGNDAGGDGGGVSNCCGSRPALVNVVFSGNSAGDDGGGMSNYNASPALINATFSSNSASRGGGIFNDNASPTVSNCILWGNTPDEVYDYQSSTTVCYSDVRGGYDGPGNINADPLFVDADGVDDIHGTLDDELRLQTVSPAVDAADNTVVPADLADLDCDGDTAERTPLDLSGVRRFVDMPFVDDTGSGSSPIVDMGAYEARLLYVSSDASGAADGSSWANAYTDLQDALEDTESGDEIWVAGGVYTPTNTGGRDATFGLTDGMLVYGGFAGTETRRCQRDWKAHATVLSGDLGGDDLTDASGVVTDTANIAGGNAYHVVVSMDVNGSTVLDGFFITGGKADGDSYPHSHGGGMYSDNASATLSNIRFSGNFASGNGGGMYNRDGSPTLTNVIFVGNDAGGDGGGVSNCCGSSLGLINVVFSGNSASDDGGGMSNYDASPALINATFSGNSASRGGGIFNDNASPTLTNCILWGNTPDEIDEGDYQSSPTVTYSDVRGGYEGAGNINANPLFVNPDGLDGIAGTPDDDLRLQPTSPAVDAADNTAVPPDLADLDCDGDTAERLPFDVARLPRFVDLPREDTGNGAPPIVDMGAYEAHMVYVDYKASGAEDGSSWANAYTDLQDALDGVKSGDEIWVAAGVYTPTNTSGRDATFELVDGVALYGGFAGTETKRDQRDWESHATVLSGDLDGNDLTNAKGVITNAAGIVGSNVYHVVVGFNVTGTTVLDGFFITGGRADGESSSHYHGGGMYSDNGGVTLRNVVFSGNFANGGGGGMYSRNSSPLLTDVTFSANFANGDGGGLYNRDSSSTLTNAVFAGNAASGGGGGLFNCCGSSPRLVNVVFSGNSASDDGGGMSNCNASPVLINATFSGNSASRGGGIFSSNGSPTVTNCILWGNTPHEIHDYDNGAIVTYSDIRGGHLGTGNINGDPLFVDTDGPDDIPGTLDDNLRLQVTSPAIDAADNLAIPPDVSEDLAGAPRFADVPDRPDSGRGTPPLVDMGAYEHNICRVHLPLTLLRYAGCFRGPWEEESNDSVDNATGPLCCGLNYHGNFTPTKEAIDVLDYFHFDLAAKTSIEISLTGIPSGHDYDLTLFLRRSPGSDLQLVDHSGTPGDGNEHIPTGNELVLQPGRYYIQVYNGTGRTSAKAYRLSLACK